MRSSQDVELTAISRRWIGNREFGMLEGVGSNAKQREGRQGGRYAAHARPEGVVAEEGPLRGREVELCRGTNGEPGKFERV